MRWKRWSAVGMACLLGFAGYRLARPQQEIPSGEVIPETAVAVRLMFGVQARGPAVWHGEARVSQGTVLRTTGVHFEQNDAVLGESQWRCGTRVTRYGDSRTERGPDPVHTQLEQLIPNGVVLALDAPESARVEVKTAGGEFAFSLGELALGSRKNFLDGDATAERLPPTLLVTRENGFNDYPSILVNRRGELWASWIHYENRADSVRVGRITAEGVPPMPVTPPGYGDNFRTAIAEDGAGRLLVVWSSKGPGRWGLYGRWLVDNQWSEIERLSGEDGPNLFHTLAADPRGRVHLVWQGFRQGRSQILHKVWEGGKWSPEVRVSSGPGDDWAPAAAADSKGNLWIGWDTYDAGNFDIVLRRMGSDGKLAPPLRVTGSSGFDANVSLAVDPSDRVWLSWDVAETNWGKDWTSVRWKPGGGNGLYRSRAVRVTCYDGRQLRAPAADIMTAIPPESRDYFQMARLQADSRGRIWAMGRGVTSFATRTQNNWGGGARWEALLTVLEGDRWMPAVRLDSAAGRNDVRAVSARAADGTIWFAWVGDRRAFRPPVASKTDVFYTRIGPRAEAAPPVMLAPFREPVEPERPVHANERGDVAAIRNYRYKVGNNTYRILRGDLHRHTDISPDGLGDGSLLDLYRYALDAAALDYILVTDHNFGGSEYSWWRTEKSEEAFYVPGRLQPLFGTERSVLYPNGHRNVIFARRGVRELPISPEERDGKVNSGAVLYPFLHKFDGITTSHTSATDQGTDWRDNDPALEPVVEIYQGLQASQEHEGAPRAETAERRYYYHGGPYRPAGFVWNAWAKGLKLGVQTSSDHIATHDSYACVLLEAAEEGGREGIINAIRQRHTYAATDNIVLDVRMGSRIMGDIFETSENPPLEVKVIGTAPIERVEVIRNNKYVHTARPGRATAEFSFRDNDPAPGESYYYVRAEQGDGQLAWSSPIWVRRR